MMKTALRVFGVLTAVAIVFLVIGGVYRTKGSPSKIQTLGLSEHGIEIIGPSEAAFDVLMSKQLQRINGADVNALKNSSVFVVNKSPQAIAALSVRWELLQRDGQSIVHIVKYSGGLKVVSDAGPAHFSEDIAPNAHRLVSLLEDPNSSNKGFRVNMAGGGIDKARQLSESVKVTVSVDGVLFVDGRFVGPDTRDFFGSLKAEIEARNEVFAEIARALNGDSEAMKRLERLAGGDSESMQMSGDRNDSSDGQSVKVRLARNTLAIRKDLGDQTVLKRINAELNKPRIELRKL
jgi:hypothetical protein